jgi:hypothetical protein
MELKIKDKIGEFSLKYEDMKTFHGGTFFGGVAIAYRIIEATIDFTSDDGALDRDDFIFMTALDAPGIMDGIEYLTRARSRNRVIVKTDLNKEAPKAPNGYYFFIAKHNNKKLLISLKHGILPEDFTITASKCKVGINTPVEFEKWTNDKIYMEKEVKRLSYNDIFDIKVIDCA